MTNRIKTRNIKTDATNILKINAMTHVINAPDIRNIHIPDTNVPEVDTTSTKTKSTKTDTNTSTVSKTKSNVNIAELENKILAILPAVQSDIWKSLNIERRQCSRLVSHMIKSGLIKKTKEGGSFMVEKIGISNNVPKNNFTALLSRTGKISPCCGCNNACNPVNCVSFDTWVREDTGQLIKGGPI